MREIKSSWSQLSPQEKMNAYNAQIDNTVESHGRMLKNRRDLSPEEKAELQAEITENAKNAKAEFAKEMEAQMKAEKGETSETGETGENGARSGSEVGMKSGSEMGNQSGSEAGNGGEGPGNGCDGGVGAGE